MTCSFRSILHPSCYTTCSALGSRSVGGHLVTSWNYFRQESVSCTRVKWILRREITLVGRICKIVPPACCLHFAALACHHCNNSQHRLGRECWIRVLDKSSTHTHWFRGLQWSYEILPWCTKLNTGGLMKTLRKWEALVPLDERNIPLAAFRLTACLPLHYSTVLIVE